MGIADNTPQKGYCVYAHINKSNGKIYIGISKNVKKRWSGKINNYKNSSVFYNALKKYGWDGFDHIIMWDNMTEEEACKIEQALIFLFKFNKQSYNIGDGGEGVLGGPMTEETKEKLRRIQLEGKFNCKKIYAFDLKTKHLVKEYESSQEASRDIKTVSANIRDAAIGKHATAGGYIWSYTTTIDSDNPLYKKATSNRARQLYCYDLHGTFIKTFNNLKEVVKELGGNQQAYCACCNRQKPSYMGYIWRWNMCDIEPEILKRIQFNRHETNQV